MAVESGARNQRGVALLIALVILTLAATLAAAMIWDTGLDVRRTANLLQGDQAREYALGAEAWAQQILRRDFEAAAHTAQTPQQPGAAAGTSVNLTQDWAMQLPPLPVEGGSVRGQLQDLQGLFNVNNLVNAQATPTAQSVAFTQFQRLLTALDLEPGIANAVLDWVNPGDQPHYPGGAKDETYTRLQPPYHTAERPMTSITELLLVAGVTPEVYRKLEPYVCALPVASLPQPAAGGASSTITVNVNTAPPLVLMSLAPNLDLGTATALAQNLATHPIEDAAALNSVWAQLTGGQRVPDNAGITSSYFRLTATVQIGSAHLTLYSLLYRNASGGTFAIRRTFGTL
ncbi:MAG TPA: type II secretion system minor pseudopilin GspK [Gammaproteobacteria bacterium]|nr:type II secretion system minor pseudopilin GspK [Gammaproteobacteria bacterium]